MKNVSAIRYQRYVYHKYDEKTIKITILTMAGMNEWIFEWING